MSSVKQAFCWEVYDLLMHVLHMRAEDKCGACADVWPDPVLSCCVSALGTDVNACTPPAVASRAGVQPLCSDTTAHAPVAIACHSIHQNTDTTEAEVDTEGHLSECFVAQGAAQVDQASIRMASSGPVKSSVAAEMAITPAVADTAPGVPMY